MTQGLKASGLWSSTKSPHHALPIQSHKLLTIIAFNTTIKQRYTGRQTISSQSDPPIVLVRWVSSIVVRKFSPEKLLRPLQLPTPGITPSRLELAHSQELFPHISTGIFPECVSHAGKHNFPAYRHRPNPENPPYSSLIEIAFSSCEFQVSQLFSIMKLFS